MEPNLPSVGPSPERPSQLPQEQAPLNASEMPSVQPEQPEHWENRGVESVNASTQSAISQAIPAVPIPTIPQPTQQVATQVDNANPASANDNDRMEKEWVAKAKQVVNATKNDPSEQKMQIDKLAADYLLKRYGKDIKQPQD